MTLTLQALINGVLLSGIYILASSGLTLIFGVMGLINFAQGELIMLGAYLAYWAFEVLGVNAIAAIPVGFAVLFAAGVLMERTIIRPVVGASHLNQVLLTFGLAIVLQNAATLLWSADTRRVSAWYSEDGISFGQFSVGVGRLIAFGTAIAVTVALYFWLARSASGRRLRAVAQDPVGARIVGISPERINALTFGVGSGLAGVAGVLVSFTLTVYPTVGLPLSLKAYAIVVLGGLGSVFGAVAGSIVLGVTESLVDIWASPSWSQGVAFGVLILMLIIRPTGLFGSRRA